MSVEAKQQKQVIIDEIKGKLENAQSAVVIDYMGITVAEADAMRKKLREANVDYTVYKNTLIKRAIEGTDYAPLAEVLDGPSAVAISTEDATAPARTLNGIIKEYKKMEFKAGVVEGTYYDKAGIADCRYPFKRCTHREVHGQHPVTSQQVRKNSAGYC